MKGNEQSGFARFEARTQAEALALYGPGDAHLNAITKCLGVEVESVGTQVTLRGPVRAVKQAQYVLEELARQLRAGDRIGLEDVHLVLGRQIGGNNGHPPDDSDAVLVTHKGVAVRPKTKSQANYLAAIDANHMTFGIGPAGTGKTYLAVAKAVAAFKAKEVQRLILTRPAVEAGERLGFLPGDMQAKVDPYLRPLYDALLTFIGADAFVRMMERGQLEVAPLAFMRGRTLDNSFIILDEAQNTTPEQMKMFLTRFGLGSKAVVTGDLTQVDLPEGKTSGLAHAREILAGIEGIAFCELTDTDVIRHELVGRIIRAYARGTAKPNSLPA